MTPPRRLPTLAAPLLLAACATPGDYPSLAQREVERATGTLAPDAAEPDPAPPTPPSAELVQRLTELQRDAQAAHSEFTRTAPAAERLATAAARAPSDSWAAAQVALADLDSLRSRAAVALAELDILWADATVAGGPREAIAPVRERVEGMIAAEDAVLARLRARVG